MSKHLRFIARTVMVKDGNIEDAYNILARTLIHEGIIETVTRRRYFEKPFQMRRRKNYENCKRIYNLEMAQKISLISRMNREDPWPGC